MPFSILWTAFGKCFLELFLCFRTNHKCLSYPYKPADVLSQTPPNRDLVDSSDERLSSGCLWEACGNTHRAQDAVGGTSNTGLGRLMQSKGCALSRKEKSLFSVALIVFGVLLSLPSQRHQIYVFCQSDVWKQLLRGYLCLGKGPEVLETNWQEGITHGKFFWDIRLELNYLTVFFFLREHGQKCSINWKVINNP